jgi:hypothetical protein
MYWTSQTLLKDNADARTQSVAEVVEVMNGGSVTMWQPTVVSRWQPGANYWRPEPVDFQLKPRGTANLCVSAEQFIVQDFKVEVPFAYAVPMLTGWQLNGDCRDDTVGMIGAYLREYSYVPNSGGTGGTLRYTIVGGLSKGDEGNLTALDSKVTVLGLQPVGTGTGPLAGRGDPVGPIAPVLAP